MSMVKVRPDNMPKLFRDTGLRFIWIAMLGLILDQVTKQMVVANFALYESIQVTGFNLTYVRNYGAAFSFT